MRVTSNFFPEAHVEFSLAFLPLCVKFQMAAEASLRVRPITNANRRSDKAPSSLSHRLPSAPSTWRNSFSDHRPRRHVAIGRLASRKLVVIGEG
jgi:hypothetical protein